MLCPRYRRADRIAAAGAGDAVHDAATAKIERSRNITGQKEAKGRDTGITPRHVAVTPTFAVKPLC
jgi:hypothetical protein